MSEVKNLTKNTVIFAIGSFSVKLIQFFLMPLVTGVMTKSDYGLSESLVSLVELLLPILTLGLQDAVFRFSMKDDVDQKKVISSTMIIVVAGFFLIALGSGIASIFLNYRYCILFALLFVCVALSNVWGQYVRGIGRVKTFAVSGIVQAVALAISTAIFVYKLRWGGEGYMLAMLCGYASSLLILFTVGGVYKGLSFRNWDKEVIKPMLRYALPLIPNNLSWWFVQVVNRYILIYFAGTAAAGVFVANSKMASFINIFGTIFLQAWTISSVKAITQSDRGKFNSDVFRVYSLFLQVVACGLLLILPFLSSFLLRGEFADTWRYSALPIFTAILSCYTAFFGAYYGAALKSKMVMVSTLIGALVNVVLAVLLTWLWGIVGSLVASIVSYFVITLIRIIDTQKYSDIKVNWIREAVVLLLVLGQAIFILKSNELNLWIYYGVQLGIIAVIAIIKHRDLYQLIVGLVGIVKKLFKKSSATVSVAQQESSETIEQEQTIDQENMIEQDGVDQQEPKQEPKQ